MDFSTKNKISLTSPSVFSEELQGHSLAGGGRRRNDRLNKCNLLHIKNFIKTQPIILTLLTFRSLSETETSTV